MKVKELEPRSAKTNARNTALEEAARTADLIAYVRATESLLEGLSETKDEFIYEQVQQLAPWCTKILSDAECQ
jgi:hypothetical protein